MLLRTREEGEGELLLELLMELEGIEIGTENEIGIGIERGGEWRGIWPIKNERINRQSIKLLILFVKPVLHKIKQLSLLLPLQALSPLVFEELPLDLPPPVIAEPTHLLGENLIQFSLPNTGSTLSQQSDSSPKHENSVCPLVTSLDDRSPLSDLNERT